MDKTQVFPFYRNDDLTRRSFHLQLVSTISRKIGRALRLNTDLIEAIALGHDMGHTPFGHAGERFLSDLLYDHARRYFNHNVHSVRLLRDVAQVRLSLQTFDGILCHCGEKAFLEYRPGTCSSFDELDDKMEDCRHRPGASRDLRPNTLEGCVVRICDMLAYLGKDRQDALNVGALDLTEYRVPDCILGETNSDFIRNASVNIIKRSMGRDHLGMDREVFDSIVLLKDLNMEQIYTSHEAHERLDAFIGPMMEEVYGRLRSDVLSRDEDSPIYRHHIRSWVMRLNDGYENSDPDDIVVDYIASMTDDYFIDLFNYLFPEKAVDKESMYHPYFDF